MLFDSLDKELSTFEKTVEDTVKYLEQEVNTLKARMKEMEDIIAIADMELTECKYTIDALKYQLKSVESQLEYPHV